MTLRPVFLIVLLLSASTPAESQTGASFAASLGGFWAEASKQGFTRVTFDAVFAGLTPDDRVLAAMRRAPEYGKPFGAYVASLASQSRISVGLRKTPTPPVILDAHTNNFGTYNLFSAGGGPFWADQAAWNLGSLTNSQFMQTITCYPDIFPAGTVFAWSYPSTPNASNTWSYPEIVYGVQGAGGFIPPPNRPTPKQVNSFSNLSVTYNITRTFADEDADCLIELWVTTVPNPNRSQTANEIAFLAHAPSANVKQALSFASHFNFSVNGFNAYIATNGQFTVIMPVTAPGGTTPLDLTSGTQTIPFLAIFQALVAHGIVVGTNWLTGGEFGFEVAKNSGGATINSIAWTWN